MVRLCANKFGREVYVAAYAHNRCELAENIGYRFSLRIDDVLQEYTVEDVYAKPAGILAPRGMIIGAVIGLLGGPVGVILGGLVGGVLGRMEDLNEKQKVATFNESNIGRNYDAPNM